MNMPQAPAPPLISVGGEVLEVVLDQLMRDHADALDAAPAVEAPLVRGHGDIQREQARRQLARTAPEHGAAGALAFAVFRPARVPRLVARLDGRVPVPQAREQPREQHQVLLLRLDALRLFGEFLRDRGPVDALQLEETPAILLQRFQGKLNVFLIWFLGRLRRGDHRSSHDQRANSSGC